MERGLSTAGSDLKRILSDEIAEPMPLPLSLLEEITGGFSDDREIGSGGFALVYKGILDDRVVAVKRLSRAYMHEKEFHQEVKCMMRAKHKNIVRFLGYCADTQGNMKMYDGKLVMADVHQRLLCFEYMPKGSFDKYITDASLEWGTCYKIIQGICEGLQYLHEKKIVHLDLKPANILLDNNMVPKIADFGLSRCFDENQSHAITENIAGTFGYFAPEFSKGVITHKVDLYSLGIIIIEILTGHKGDQAIKDVLERWSDRLERSQKDTKCEQIRVCYEIGMECRDSDPEKRPASAANIVDRLREIEIIQTAEASASTSRTKSNIDQTTSVFGSIEVGASTRKTAPAAASTAYVPSEMTPPPPVKLKPQEGVSMKMMSYLYVRVVQARNLPTLGMTGPLDSYVELNFGNLKSVTKHMERNPNPVWRQVFAFSLDDGHLESNQLLEVIVMDKDVLNLKNDLVVGRVRFDMDKIRMRLPADSPLAPKWYRLAPGGEIMLSLWLGAHADEAFQEAHRVGHFLEIVSRVTTSATGFMAECMCCGATRSTESITTSY